VPSFIFCTDEVVETKRVKSRSKKGFLLLEYFNGRCPWPTSNGEAHMHDGRVYRTGCKVKLCSTIPC